MRWKGAAAGASVVLVLTACTSKPPKAAPAPPPAQVVSADPSVSASAPAVTDDDWPTNHHDSARTGVAKNFPPAGKLSVAWQAKLDGAVYGQPLVVGDRVLAATENDTVYALDAATGRVLWSAHVGTPVRKSTLPCGNIDPLGITGSMVYDPSTGLVFALAEVSGKRHELVGVDLATGALRTRRAAEPPKGDSHVHQQRPALTLLNGRVYIAFGGLAGDCGNYIGAVISVPTTGDGPVASYAVPTPREGGIWAPGAAPLLNGRLLYSVGNGESTTTKYDGSDSVIALNPDLTLADRFTAAPWADDNAKDLDLGSMNPAVVGGNVLIAGKRGEGYLLHGDRLGAIGGQVFKANLCRAFGMAAVDGDTAYVPCTDGPRAVTVSGDRFQVKWKGPAGARGAPVVGGGAVWLVDYDGGLLYALDPQSGAVREQIQVGRCPHFASPSLSRGRAFVGTMNGVVAVAGS
jgi:outer membrane protein assembly factor BamB